MQAAIARCDWREMEARDYQKRDSKTHVRRWSRNDDGVRALLASSEELDVYWSNDGSDRTLWRIVLRERVDGFIQAIHFDSVGIRELRAAELSAKEGAILEKCVAGGAEHKADRGGRPRL